MPSPDIPINPQEAFFPLRISEEGNIYPSYQWRECVKKFIICLKWEEKTIYFSDLTWFYSNDFGLCKRETP